MRPDRRVGRGPEEPEGSAARADEFHRQREQLRDTQTQLRIVTECMAAPVTRCSRDLKYLWVSKPYADWIGRSCEEVVGRSILDILGKEAFEQLLPRFEQVLAGKRVQYEEQVNYRGLGLRWISAIYTPTFDVSGVPDGWVAIVLDVTQQRRTEEALRASERRFSMFMQELPGLAWIKDLQGRYVYANEAAMKVFQLPRDALYGKTDDEVFPPETAAQFKQNDAKALANASGIQIVESLKHADGIMHHSLVSKFPIVAAEGSPAFVGGMAIDITEQREADRRKDEFLATLAHELRNPLAPICNAVETLGLASGNAAIAEDARRIMDRQLRQMVRLIDDLLDVARITSGKLQICRARIEFASVVQSAVEAARPLIDAQNHELTVTLPSGPVPLDADAVRLAQVFSNLINNAAKYTPKGGHVWLTAERQAGRLAVSVRDTGVGIAAEHLSHIFEMFSQVTPVLERSHGGLGIGLAIIRGLVELHGGRVEARSAGLGRGSEFIVELPVIDAPMQQPLPRDDDQALCGARKCRVLAADDLRDSVDSLAVMLRLMGHDLRTAYDGLEAVQAAATFRPDVMLLDVGMPKMNGYEAARYIRAQPWGKEIMLVALTGWGQDDDKQRAAEAGFDHHLTKPLSLDALRKLFRTVGRLRDGDDVSVSTPRR
jgi:PAS domain S-box-containing protein